MRTILAQRPTLIVALMLLLFLLLAVAMIGISTLRAHGISGQQTVLVGPDQLTPGQEAVMRAVVQDFNSGRPLPGSQVEAFLRAPGQENGLPLYQGVTDQTGSAEIRFLVPADQAGDMQVLVHSTSRVGSDELIKPVTLRRDYKLLLTTDKPLYQPGQTIHARSLALAADNLSAAAGQPVEFTIEDPKGNKVFKQQVNTSDYGIASFTFPLANEVNTGSYKILARMVSESPGSNEIGTVSEKTVTVKPYVLPKFQVNLQTDRPWYLPGQRVQGSLQAGYFFGKPVSEGQVTISGWVYEVERRQVLELTGVTDAQGTFQFEFDLPDTFVSGAPEVGQAAFGLEVTVIDQANQAEQVAQSLPVAEQPLLMDVVAESGSLKPGLENIIYILTSYPNGAPAQTEIEVTVNEQRETLTTGSAGLAELRFTPPPSPGPIPLRIVARDTQGHESSIVWGMEAEQSQETVLLRPEQAAYQVGETLHVDILSSFPEGTAYLDIIRAGQTISTQALQVVDGKATTEIDLDETLFGTLELHAYQVLRDASLVADTRLVIVDRASDIDIAIEADQDTYRPGDPATISFRTSREGLPLPAALGMSIVDESVFALQEQEAGFARLYFLLQAEILEPKYQIKGFSPQWLVAPPPGQEAEIEVAQDTSARAALAANPMPEPAALSLPRFEKQRAIEQEQAAMYLPVLILMVGGMALLGLAGLAVSVMALIRQHLLGRSLLWAVGGLIILILLIGLLFWLATATPFSEALLCLTIGVVLALLAGFLGLMIQAWRSGDRPLQTLLLLVATFVLALPLLILVLNLSDPQRMLDSDSLLVWAIFGLVGLLGAFYLRGAGFAAAGERRPALFGFLVGLGVPLIMSTGFLVMIPGRSMMPPGLDLAGSAAPMPAAPLAMEVPAEMEMEEAAAEPASEAAEGQATGQEPPRLRQFFPETLYWNPEVITDETGQASVQLDTVADSITTWRLSILASSQQGELGNASAGLRVFQDFFVDLDLPLYLTQNDEVSLPVAVFNYLPEAQQVRLVVESQPWFELLDEPEKTLTIQSNDVDVVYFRIRAVRFGRSPFQVTAWGEFMSDAIVKEVQVLPDGKRFRDTQSDRLEAGETVLNLPIPETYIAGTGRVFVKIYPGVVSQVVEGLQGMLRMPFG